MDTIVIKGLEVFAYHGVNPEEKRDGQRFVLDVAMTVDLATPCATDDLNTTVSYSAVIKTIRAVMTAQSDDLIERAAQRVADAILETYPLVEAVTVRLQKPDAPMKATFDYVAVEITRSR